MSEYIKHKRLIIRKSTPTTKPHKRRCIITLSLLLDIEGSLSEYESK